MKKHAALLLAVALAGSMFLASCSGDGSGLQLRKAPAALSPKAPARRSPPAPKPPSCPANWSL